MTSYRLLLTSRSDVSPAANRERGFFTPSYPYLPGGALRGALAARWIARFGTPDERFQREVAALRVGPGIAVGSVQRPLSVYSCKYPTQVECHEVFDAAFGELPADRTCPGCGRALEASKGQWEGDLRRRTITRTALSQDQTAESGSLFSRESLTVEQEFAAIAHGSLDWLRDGPVAIRVGGQRSVAGKMALVIEPITTEPDPVLGDDRTVVVRLLAPAVFLGQDARTRLNPQSGDIARAVQKTSLESRASEIAVREAWTRPDTVGGWNAAAGLPKATEVAASGGSTYVLESPVAITASDRAAMVRHGMGVRRADGLGWVQIPSSPWRPATRPEGRVDRRPESSRVAEVADRIDRLRDSREVRRQVSGWLRDGFTASSLPPGYAFDGLGSDVRTVAEDALAIAGEERRALLMVLQARDHRARSTAGKGGRS